LNIEAQIQKAESYIKAFPKFEPLSITKSGRIEGLWVMGNNYTTKTKYYGAYPHGYLKRVLSMFPEIEEKDILHVCSGSIEPGKHTRIDSNSDLNPDICCNVEEMSKYVKRKYKLALVDVPYSKEDAEHYGTVMLSRKKTLAECWEVLEEGGWVIWLDQVLPMFAKRNWFWGIAIGMVKSTNHRVRAVFGFQKVITQ
jgi:hypothetical protein